MEKGIDCPRCDSKTQHNTDEEGNRGLDICPNCGWLRYTFGEGETINVTIIIPDQFKRKQTCPGCGHPRSYEYDGRKDNYRYLCCTFCGKTVIQAEDKIYRFDNLGHTSRHNTGK